MTPEIFCLSFISASGRPTEKALLWVAEVYPSEHPQRGVFLHGPPCPSLLYYTEIPPDTEQWGLSGGGALSGTGGAAALFSGGRLPQLAVPRRWQL